MMKIKIIKALFFSLGGLIGFIPAFFLITMYAGTTVIDSKEAHLHQSLSVLHELLVKSERLLINNEKIQGFYLAHPAQFPKIARLYQSSSGDILLTGATDQIAWLRPVKETEKIHWYCKGATKYKFLDRCPVFN